MRTMKAKTEPVAVTLARTLRMIWDTADDVLASAEDAQPLGDALTAIRDLASEALADIQTVNLSEGEDAA